MTIIPTARVGSVRHGRAVYLLHFAGSPDHPVRRKVSPTVQVIGAVRSEFDSVVQGDILGFDGHPGPYWHCAISRKLPGVIARQL